MRSTLKWCISIVAACVGCGVTSGQTVAPGSRVVIAPMGGFETYFAAAVQKKNVPVTLTLDKTSAQYFVVSTDTEWQGFVYGSGTSANWSRSGGSVYSGSAAQSTRGLEASIMLINAKTKDVVWAYEVHKSSHGALLLGTLAARGKQSVAEACAKHLKDFIEKQGSANLKETSTKEQSVKAPTQASNVNVSSIPSGAEIYLDDEFAGSTPSFLNISEGKHAFSLRKMGYQDWDREMNISGGSINLAAELQAGAVPLSPAPASSASAKKYKVEDGGPAQLNPEQGWIGFVTKTALGGGVQIISVEPGGPASKAGLMPGDVTTHVNGTDINGESDFQCASVASWSWLVHACWLHARCVGVRDCCQCRQSADVDSFLGPVAPLSSAERETPMNSPIAFRGFDEDEYRSRVRAMSDQDLMLRERTFAGYQATAKL